MRSLFAALLATASLLPVPASAETADEAVDRLEQYLQSNQVGAGRDVWLAKSWMGELDRVALFFGYYDDLGACQDAARVLNAAYPDAGYVCTYVTPED